MFKLPKKVKDQIEDYRKSLRDYLKGNDGSDRFKGVRVPWGFYSHRGGKIFMSRVRVPAQIVSSAQLGILAETANQYSSSPLHVTTRGDIQIHSIDIKDTVNILDDLKNYELSSRGGGGNTVRNIVSCPLAGVCPDEEFDFREYPISLTEFLLNDDKSFNLPRKYKIAFSGCYKDCALATVNDLGFIAKIRDDEKGFCVYVGGGMGAISRVADKLEEFVYPEDVGYIAEAVKRVFYRHGNRKNKHRARLRFLIDDIGLEEFRRIYREELESLKSNEYIGLRKIKFEELSSIEDEEFKSDSEDFNTFKKYNINRQKQSGYYYIKLRIKLGDIYPEQLKLLVEISRKFVNIEFRTTNEQNIYIVNVRGESLHPIYAMLKKGSLAEPFACTVLDLTCCQGSETCNLGICNSKVLARKMIEEFENIGLDLDILNGVNIKINGCPNGCAQHPVGVIGMSGLARKVNLRPVPFYRIFTGGRVQEGKTKLAEHSVIVPVKNIIEVIKEFLLFVQDNIHAYDDLYQFIENEGRMKLKEIAKKFAHVPDYDEDSSYYRDYGSDEDFSLEGMGPGECGAGVMDMIEADLTNAKDSFDNDCLRDAVHYAALALLIVKGLEPKTQEEAVDNFMEYFVKEGISSQKFSDLIDVFKSPEPPAEYVRDFIKEVNSIYQSMDNNFKFPVKKKDETEIAEQEKAAEVKILDLKGVACPMNYVKSKLFMEQMKPGEVVEILLDEGEPIKNVPPSLKNDGQKIEGIEKENGYFRVKVKKG